ncbi:hypothetical protein FFY45_09635 [Xanthomonas hortorum]|nr:hypothetical protein [Xanthomonas hortorum]
MFGYSQTIKSKAWLVESSRGCGALTACGTRRKSVPGGSVAASMPPHGPAIGEGTAPGRQSGSRIKSWPPRKLRRLAGVVRRTR